MLLRPTLGLRRRGPGRKVQGVEGFRRIQWLGIAARALTVRAGSALLAIVLLTAFFTSGSRYFYCPVMKVAMTTSCCARQHVIDEAEAEASAALVASDCCEARRIASVPSAPLPLPHEELVAPIVATLPANSGAAADRAERPVARFTHPVRAGPPTPAGRRALLMIWSC